MIHSPYFSPGTKTQRKTPRSSTDDQSQGYEHLKNLLPEVGQVQNQFMSNDPLFRYYFRKFLDLYKQLSLLKPKLIQESVVEDSWKLLVAVTLLNKTTGKAAIPVFLAMTERWPSPWAMSQANQAELKDYIYCLGTYNIRSKRLIEMSIAYIRDPPHECDIRLSRSASPIKQVPAVIMRRQGKYPPTPISHLPGVGSYALDSYRIFCLSHNNRSCDEWKTVLPTDKELILYLRWKWAYEERKEWSPLTGHVTSADISFLETLIDELIKHHTHPKSR